MVARKEETDMKIDFFLGVLTGWVAGVLMVLWVFAWMGVVP